MRVARYGEGTGDVRVRASIEGGRELATRRITLSEGEPTSVVMSADLPPDASARGSVVRVTLEPVDGEDPFTLDDVAVAPSGPYVVVVSVIDNLVKGASGQALQNMNVMLGLDETAGLS